MSDQAATLRDIVNSKTPPTRNTLKIFTVTSGKGGVGKSNFTANIALALKELGQRVLILDADFGLSNIDLILGVRPRYNLAHLLAGNLSLQEVITNTPYGISFISGGNGVKEMLYLDKFQIEKVAIELSTLAEVADVVLIDTGAGINDIVIKFCEIADEVCLIVTPDPSSITDAYALLKTFTKDFFVEAKYNVILNGVDSPNEGMSVFKKIDTVSKSFLNLNLHFKGYIPYDTNLVKAVRKSQPIYYINRNAQASIAYNNIAKNLLHYQDTQESALLNKEPLVSKLRRILKNQR
ncbi:MinD/ParA family protein [Candidatus Epulonipiscium viviparus]|uniref:MinD/ParA family protein n=1 Tax=Candidatus Epulonipiscium viviparus TaxID=420336 RepID=UPI00016C0EF2|nr:MinD/ParA family protein [Candidatus Epulopiscium viviparus]